MSTDTDTLITRDQMRPGLDWTGGVRHPNPYRQEAER